MDNEPNETDGIPAGDRTAPKQTEWRKYSKTLIEELKKKLEDRRTRTLELLSENKDLIAFHEIDTESDGLDDTSTNVTLKQDVAPDQHGLAEHLLALFETSSMTESDYCDELDSKLSDCPYSVDVVRCEGECTHSSYSTTTSASCASLISEGEEDEELEFGMTVINKMDPDCEIQEDPKSMEKLALLNQNHDAGDTYDVLGNHIREGFGDKAREVNAVCAKMSFVDQIFSRDILKSSIHSDLDTKDSSLEPRGELSVRLTESFTDLLGDSFTDSVPNCQLAGNGDVFDTVKEHNDDDDTARIKRGKHSVEKEVSDELNEECEVNSNHLNNPYPMVNMFHNDAVNQEAVECKIGGEVDETQKNQFLSSESHDRFVDMKNCRFRDNEEIEGGSAESECIEDLFENGVADEIYSNETDRLAITVCEENEKRDMHEDKGDDDIFQNESTSHDSESAENNILDRVDEVNKIVEVRRTIEEANEATAVLMEVDNIQLDLTERPASDTQIKAETEVPGPSFIDKLSNDVIYSSKVKLEEIFDILKNNTFLNSDVDKEITALLETCVVEISAFQNISSNSGYPSMSRDGWSASLASVETSHLPSQFTSDCDPIVRRRHLHACLEKAQLASALQKKIGRMNNRVENFAAKRAYEKAVGDFEDILSEFFKTYASCPDDLTTPESKSSSPRSPRLPPSKTTQKRALSRSNTFVINKARSRSPNTATTSKQFLKPDRTYVPKAKNYKNDKLENAVSDDKETDLPPTASPTFFVLQERNSLFPTKEKEKKRRKKPSRRVEKVKLLSRSQRTRDSGTFIIHSSYRDSNTSSDSETSDSITENPETDTCQYTSSMLTQLLDYDSQEDELTAKEKDKEVYCSGTSGMFSKTTNRETLNDGEARAVNAADAGRFVEAVDGDKEAPEKKDVDAGKYETLTQRENQIEEDEQINYESDFNAESISEVIHLEEESEIKEEDFYVEDIELERTEISCEPLCVTDTGKTCLSSSGKDEIIDWKIEYKQPVIENKSEDVITSLEKCVASNECNEVASKAPSTADDIDIIYEFSKNLPQLFVDFSSSVKESLQDSQMNLDRPSVDQVEEYPSTRAGISCGVNSVVDKIAHVSRPSHRKWLLKKDNHHNDLDDITAQFVPTVDWTSSDEDLIDDLKRDKSPSDILKKKQKDIVDEKLKQLTQISKRNRKSRSPVRYRSSSQVGANPLKNLACDLRLNDMSWTGVRDFQDPTSCFTSLGEISKMSVDGRYNNHDPTRPSVSELLLARIDEESNENAAEVFDDSLEINKEELSGCQLIIQTDERSKAVRSTVESMVRIHVGSSPSRSRPPSSYSGESPTKPVGSHCVGHQNMSSQPSVGIPSLSISGEFISSMSSTSGEFIFPALSNSLLLSKSETTLKKLHDEFSKDPVSFVYEKGEDLKQVPETVAQEQLEILDQILSPKDDADAVDKDELTWQVNDQQHSCNNDSRCARDSPPLRANHATSGHSLVANENVIREVAAMESKIICSSPEIFIALSKHECSILHEKEDGDTLEHTRDIGNSRVNLNPLDDYAGTQRESIPLTVSNHYQLDPADINCPFPPSDKTTVPLTPSGISENGVMQSHDKSYENDRSSSKEEEDKKCISEQLYDWLFLGEGTNFVQHLEKSRSLKLNKCYVYKVVNPELFQMSPSPSPLKQYSSQHIPQRNMNMKNLSREKVMETEYVPTTPVHRKLDQHRRCAQKHNLRQDGLYFSHWEEDGSPKSSDLHCAATRQCNFSIPVREEQTTAKITSEHQSDMCFKIDNSTLLALCDKLTSLEKLLTSTNTVSELRDGYGTQHSTTYKQMTSRGVATHTKSENPAPCSCSFEASCCPSVICPFCGCDDCRPTSGVVANTLCDDVLNSSRTQTIAENPNQSSVVNSSSKATQTEGCKPLSLALINRNQSTQTSDCEPSPSCVKFEEIQLLANQLKEVQNYCQCMKLYASVESNLDKLEQNVGCELQRVATNLKTEVGDLISQTRDHVTQMLTSQLAAAMDRLNNSVRETMAICQHYLTQQGTEIKKLLDILLENKSGAESKEQNVKKGMDYNTMKMRVVELTSQRDAEKVFHKITRESLRALERDHDRLRQEYIRATYRKADLGTESGVRKRLLDLLAEKDELPTQRNRHRHERDSHSKCRSRHTTDIAKRVGDQGWPLEGDHVTAFKPRQSLLLNKTDGEVLLDSSEHLKKCISGDRKGLTKSKQFFNTSPVSERNNHQRTYVSCEVQNLMPKHNKPATCCDRSNQRLEHRGDVFIAGDALIDNDLSSLDRQLTDQMTSVSEPLARGDKTVSRRYHKEMGSKKSFSISARKSSLANIKLRASPTSTSQFDSCPTTDAADTGNTYNSVLTTTEVIRNAAVATDKPLSLNANNSPGYLTDEQQLGEKETAYHKLNALDVGINESKSSLVLSGESF